LLISRQNTPALAGCWLYGRPRLDPAVLAGRCVTGVAGYDNASHTGADGEQAAGQDSCRGRAGTHLHLATRVTASGRA
jgi:hypothetical protein